MHRTEVNRGLLRCPHRIQRDLHPFRDRVLLCAVVGRGGHLYAV